MFEHCYCVCQEFNKVGIFNHHAYIAYVMLQLVVAVKMLSVRILLPWRYSRYVSHPCLFVAGPFLYPLRSSGPWLPRHAQLCVLTPSSRYRMIEYYLIQSCRHFLPTLRDRHVYQHWHVLQKKPVLYVHMVKGRNIISSNQHDCYLRSIVDL